MQKAEIGCDHRCTAWNLKKKIEISVLPLGKEAEIDSDRRRFFYAARCRNRV